MPMDNMSELKKRIPGGKYVLTRAVAERARQLQGGDTPLVEVRTPNPLSVAIDEIVGGKVSFHFETASAETDTAKKSEASDASGDGTL